jgi:hypothetical protein
MSRSTPLSAEARRLLELGSHVEPPTSEQDERMARALAPLFRTGRPGPLTLEGAATPTRASAPAAGSPLGGAEARSANPHGASHGNAPGHENTGVRVRAASRATPRFFGPLPGLGPRHSWGPLHGLRDAKLWLTLGALAATASASFWLGRLSTPAELAPTEFALAGLTLADLPPALDAHRPERVVAPPAEPTPALASASLAAPLVDAPDRAVSNLEPSSLALSSVPQPEPGAAGGARAASHTSRPRAGTQAQRSLGLAAEIEQLARAEAALRQGRAAHALLVLEQRSVQHLKEQAAALRAIAECELGVATAAGSAREVLERWPASAFQPRIARACQQ